MKNLSENGKLGRVPSLINNKGQGIAVAFVLIFVSSLLIGYYFVSRLPPEGYTTVYTLSYPQK